LILLYTIQVTHRNKEDVISKPLGAALESNIRVIGLLELLGLLGLLGLLSYRVQTQETQATQ
jgi:hypothetical protein